MRDALRDRRVVAVVALDFEKAGDLAHVDSRTDRELCGFSLPAAACHFGERAAIFDRHHLAELAAGSSSQFGEDFAARASSR